MAVPILLLTSAGSLVSDAIMQCLADVRGRLSIVGVNSTAAPTAFRCDRLYRVPQTVDAAAYEAALCAVIEAERPDLVLAGRDEDVPILTALAAGGCFPRTAFPVPPPSLAPLFLDKRLTHRFAREHGLPFAPTADGLESARALAREHGFPLLAKPWRGAGSRGVWLLGNDEEVSAAAADPSLMIQAFCGPESVDDALGAFRRSAARGLLWRWAFQDLETNAELTLADDGSVSSFCLDVGVTAPPYRTDIRLLDDDAAAEVALSWGRTLGASGHRGPLNIQGKRMPDGRFIPYEIGARFGGTAAVRAALGHNQVRHLVSGVLGWTTADAGAHRASVSLQTRSTSVPDAWRLDFERAGRWSAASARAWPRPRGAGGKRALVAGLGTQHGAAQLDALAAWRPDAFVIGTASDPSLPDLHRCDRAILMPPESAPEYAGRLAAVLAENGAESVFAASDASLAVLSGRVPSLRWVLGRGCRDRLAVVRYAREHGLPFVPCAGTVREASALVGRTGFPLIAKPRRGGGTPLLLERWEEVAAALAAGETVVQPVLGAGRFATQQAAWRTRPGAPWDWALTDEVEVAETVVGPDGCASPLRMALCVRRGGAWTDLQPISDVTVADPARRWIDSLIRSGHRGPFRLSGKRTIDGAWMPFSASPYLLGIPDEGSTQSRVSAPAVTPLDLIERLKRFGVQEKAQPAGATASSGEAATRPTRCHQRDAGRTLRVAGNPAPLPPAALRRC